jgi:tetratricopeptide (TPR) repeat protein
MNKKAKSKRKDSIFTILLIPLVIIMAISVLFRGGFFELETRWVLLLIAITYIYYIWKLGFNDLVTLDIVAAGYAITSILLLFFSVDLYSATYTAVKILGGYFFYLLLRKYFTVEGISSRNSILLSIYLIGLVSCIIGIIAGSGFDLYFDAFKDGRIYSTFQYPNSAGLYYLICMLIGLYLGLCNNTYILRETYYLIGNSILMVGIVGSLSRGIILIYPFILIALFFTYKSKKYRLIYNMLVTNFIGIFIYFIMIKYKLFTLPILAIILTMLYYIGHKISVISIQLLQNKYITIGVVFLICITIFIGLQDQSYLSVLGRFKRLGLAESSIYARFVFFNDALKIIKNYWLVGAGGGGWNALYHAFKSFDYYTSEIHNYYLQVLVESGIVGLSFVLVLILLSVKNYLRMIKVSDREMYTTLLIAFCAFLAHNFIDFNMSFFSFTLLFWFFIAFSYSEPNLKTKTILKYRTIVQALNVILILFIIIFPISRITSEIYSKKILGHKEFNQVISSQKTLSILDPTNPIPHVNVARLYASLATAKKDISYYDFAIKELNKAISITKHDYGLYIMKANYLLKKGETKNALTEATKASKLQPFNIRLQEDVSKVYYEGVQQYLNQKNYDEAKQTASLLVKNVDDLLNRWAMLTDIQRSLWMGKPRELTPNLQLYYAFSKVILNDGSIQQQALNFDGVDEELKPIATLIKGISLRESDKEKATELISDATRDINTLEIYNNLCIFL